MRYPKKNNPGKELAQRFADFISNKYGDRSPHTIEGYKYAMRLFADFIEEKKRATANTFGIEFFTEENGIEFKKWLNERGVGKNTINERLSQITAFLKSQKKDAVYARYYYEFRDIPRYKVPKKTCDDQRVLTKKVVKAILDAAKPTTVTGLRYSTEIHMLYETATRISEITSAKIKDLHLTETHPYVKVMGKGAKTRVIPLVKSVVSKLKRYIASEHGDAPNPEDYLFPSRSKGKGEKSSTRGFNKQIEVYRRIAQKTCPEVPDHIHAHEFRRARATHWLEDGLNIFQVSKLLGHKSVQTTMIYLRFTEKMKEDALSKVENNAIKDIPAKWKKPNACRDLF